MKKSILLLSSLLVVALFQLTLTSNSTGMTGVASAGCNGPACHTKQETLTSISLQVNGGTPPASYVPGQLYSITLLVTRSAKPKKPAGFDLEFSNGVISNAPAGTAIGAPGGTVSEISHSSPQITSAGGLALWDFKWTAPAAGAGDVTISVAANVADSNGGANAGDDWNYLSTPITMTEGAANAKPTITALKVSGVSNTAATIGSTINANNLTAKDTYEYGLTTSYGTILTPASPTIIGNTPTVRSVSITGLTPNATYHWRVRSSNSGGQSISVDTILKTSAAATPIITGVGHTNLTNTSAKISATINANGTTTTSIKVYYGTTTSYTDSVSTTPASASGTTNTAVSVTIPGLVKNTLYNYQVRASNSAGTSTSSNISFTTTNTTGIANIITKEFGMYPNPSTDYLYISSDVKDVREIYAISLSGRAVRLDAQKLATDHYKVSTKNLSSGVYYIRLRTNEGWMEHTKAVTIE